MSASAHTGLAAPYAPRTPAYQNEAAVFTSVRVVSVDVAAPEDSTHAFRVVASADTTALTVVEVDAGVVADAALFTISK